MKRIAVLTSGGDSPGMNPAIYAITRAGLNLGLEVVGVCHGYQGLLNRDFIPLDRKAVHGVGRRGGTFLQSSRCPEFVTEEGQKKALANMESEGIEGLIVIGGDGSLRGAQALHELGFPVIGLPGTIDNDLGGTDMGIGVDTALNTIIHLVDMIKDTASSHQRCFIVEVMGRGSGYLAGVSTIATQSQVAVIPECPMNMERIIRIIQERFQEDFRNTLIILAEGVCSAHEFKEKIDAAWPEADSIEIRTTVLGHVQRGGSPSHYDRLLASELGTFAVRSLLRGERGVMAGLIKKDLVLTPLTKLERSPGPFRQRMVDLAQGLGIEFGDLAL